MIYKSIKSAEQYTIPTQTLIFVTICILKRTDEVSLRNSGSQVNHTLNTYDTIISHYWNLKLKRCRKY